jgi:hypothetical protein
MQAALTQPAAAHDQIQQQQQQQQRHGGCRGKEPGRKGKRGQSRAVKQPNKRPKLAAGQAAQEGAVVGSKGGPSSKGGRPQRKAAAGVQEAIRAAGPKRGTRPAQVHDLLCGSSSSSSSEEEEEEDDEEETEECEEEEEEEEEGQD